MEFEKQVMDGDNAYVRELLSRPLEELYDCVVVAQDVIAKVEDGDARLHALLDAAQVVTEAARRTCVREGEARGFKATDTFALVLMQALNLAVSALSNIDELEHHMSETEGE